MGLELKDANGRTYFHRLGNTQNKRRLYRSVYLIRSSNSSVTALGLSIGRKWLPFVMETIFAPGMRRRNLL